VARTTRSALHTRYTAPRNGLYPNLTYYFLTTSLPLPYHFLTTPFPLSSLFNIKAREQHNRAVEAAMLAEDEEHDLGGGFSGGFY
jgi:hypothetical protein